MNETLSVIHDGRVIVLDQTYHIRLIDEWSAGRHTVELTAEVDAQPEWLVTGATLRLVRMDYPTLDLTLLRVVCHRDTGRGPGPYFYYEIMGALTAR